jgi:hypothetical protein
MSRLFGKSEAKDAAANAARTEVERLNALPVADLAAELMPAFGPDGPRSGKEINSLQASSWLMRSYPTGSKQSRDLHRAVCEGLELLEHSGLVEILNSKRGSVATGAHLRATRLGESALASDQVASHLGHSGRS